MNSETPAIVPCEGLKCVKSVLGKVNTLSFTEKYNLVTSLIRVRVRDRKIEFLI